MDAADRPAAASWQRSADMTGLVDRVSLRELFCRVLVEAIQIVRLHPGDADTVLDHEIRESDGAGRN